MLGENVDELLEIQLATFREEIHVRADQYDRFDLDLLTDRECVVISL